MIIFAFFIVNLTGGRLFKYDWHRNRLQGIQIFFTNLKIDTFKKETKNITQVPSSVMYRKYITCTFEKEADKNGRDKNGRDKNGRDKNGRDKNGRFSTMSVTLEVAYPKSPKPKNLLVAIHPMTIMAPNDAT